MYIKTTSTEANSTKHASACYEINLYDGSSLAGKTITLTSKASSNVSSYNYCSVEYRDKNNAYLDYQLVSKTTDFTTDSFVIPSGAYYVILRINQSYEGTAETEFIINSLIIDGEQII